MGFFQIANDKKSKPRKNGTPSCEACGLYRAATTPKMPAYGDGREGILIVAESPGAAEDRAGEALIGQPGQYLTKVLDKMGVDIERDCRKINAVCCRTPPKESPTDFQIDSCRSRVIEEIETFRPSLIIPLGGTAIKSVIGSIFPGKIGGIKRWRGFCIPDQKTKAWICPTFHPAMVLKEEKKRRIAERVFEDDLRRALSTKNHEFATLPDPSTLISILTNKDDIIAAIEAIIFARPPLISFDYETTGLKPQRKGHAIVYASVTWSEWDTIAFPLYPEVVPIFKRLLRAAYIGKTAHNLGFEDTWSYEILGTVVEGWEWCSMIAAHVEDNRQGVNDLEFQAYTKLGIGPWSDEITPFLKQSSDEEKSWGANGFNQVRIPSTKKILTYVGMDSWTGYLITKKQQQTILSDPGLSRGYYLLFDGKLALAKAERRGVHTDILYCERTERELLRLESEIEEKLRQNRYIKAWEKEYGPRFNLQSDDQMAWFLYDFLGIEATEFTDSGKPSTSGSILEGWATQFPFLKELLRLRKYNKARTTYIGALIRETIDGYCHPFFHLHTVQTYRSSSRNPNWQNVPIRDKEIGPMIRKAVLPSLGRVLIEIDYSGVEVRVATCYHKDKNMIAYINDPSTDMHRDTAMSLFDISTAEWDKIPGKYAKPLRQTAKNGFVFAQFYGDYYVNCAKNIWNQCKLYDLRMSDDMTIFQWLETKGIFNYEDFEDHVQKVENHFWGVMFAEYDAWRDEHVDAYTERGYFDLFTGFRCSGLMSRNEVTNYPVQGAAFHCLLWSFIHMTKWMEDSNMKSFPVAQIHDSIIIDAVPEEITSILTAAHRIMCEDIKKDFPWLIVPLEIEADVTPVDGSWNEKKAVSHSECGGCSNEWLWVNKHENHKTSECPACGWKHSVTV